jgi:crotonobetainyl-CoA:carnitine CoA-transferase CaiB-like acyl-CoA transferase
MLLADMGAEVIKVEPPWGDASRLTTRYPRIEGNSSYFMFVNRGKKSIVLNLKSEKGIKALKKIVKTSDVIVENFRPGVMDRLGIGYEVLKQVNPNIIFASISGFGQSGPYVAWPSFDIIAQAMSGWMWLNSREKRGLNCEASFVPTCLAGSPGDTIPGLFCALSILAALHARNKTGQGQKIDVAQTDSLMLMMGLALVRYLSGDSTADERARLPSKVIHGVYEAKDGFIVIRAVNEKAQGVLAEAIGINPDSLEPSSEILVNWFKNRSRKEISNVLSKQIPCAPVITDEELVNDPNVLERKMILETEHPQGFIYRSVANGIKFSDNMISTHPKSAPLLGQDTAEILTQIGYDKNYIKQLEEEKVINKI